MLTVAFYMNKDGHLEGSKKLGIITINLYLFCVSYVEGLRSGQYLLFFPLILALIFVIDLKRNLNEVIITSVVTLLSTAFIFIFAPYQNTLQNIPQDLYSSLFSTNLAISLLLTTVFAYLILKTLENHGGHYATIPRHCWHRQKNIRRRWRMKMYMPACRPFLDPRDPPSVC